MAYWYRLHDREVFWVDHVQVVRTIRDDEHRLIRVLIIIDMSQPPTFLDLTWQIQCFDWLQIWKTIFRTTQRSE